MADDKKNPLEDIQPGLPQQSTSPTDVPDTPTVEEQQQQSERKGCSIWVWLLAIIVACGVFVGAYFFFAHEEGDAARRQASEMAAQAAEDSIAALPDNAAINATDAQIATDASAQTEMDAEQQAIDRNLDNDGLQYKSGRGAAETTGSDVDDLAQRTIHGDFGNHPVRAQRLGTRYPEVQKRVNKIMHHSRHHHS